MDTRPSAPGIPALGFKVLGFKSRVEELAF